MTRKVYWKCSAKHLMSLFSVWIGFDEVLMAERSRENCLPHFKLHLKPAFETGWTMLIIYQGKRLKPPLKEFWWVQDFFIKMGARLKNEGALCELLGAIPKPTLNCYSGALSLKKCFLFQTDSPWNESLIKVSLLVMAGEDGGRKQSVRLVGTIDNGPLNGDTFES